MYIRVKDRHYIEELQYLDNIPVPMKDIFEWLYELTKSTNQILGNNETYKMYCTYCQNTHILDHKAKMKEMITCPHCGNEFEFHRMKYSHTSKEEVIWFNILQKVDGIIYSRYFYGHKRIEYDNCNYGIYISEVRRKRIDNEWTLRHSSSAGKMIADGPDTNRKSYGYCCGDYEEYKSWLYPTGVKELFENTEYKYSAIELIAGKRVGLKPFEYVRDTLSISNKERLAKMGFYNLAVEYTYCYHNDHDGLLNQLRSQTKEKFNMLRKMDCSFNELNIAIKCECETEQEIKQASKFHNQYDDIRKYLSKQKAYEYLPNVKDIVSYHDYLKWCDELGENMKDKRVLFPKNLKDAHDEKMKMISEIKNKKISESIKKSAEKLKKYFYENGKFMIRPAQSYSDLVEESKELNHCVRTYAKNMAEGKTAIFLIRSLANPEKPLVTLELKKNEVIQVRAKNNGMPEPVVKKFVKQWEKQFHLTGY